LRDTVMNTALLDYIVDTAWQVDDLRTAQRIERNFAELRATLAAGDKISRRTGESRAELITIELLQTMLPRFIQLARENKGVAARARPDDAVVPDIAPVVPAVVAPVVVVKPEPGAAGTVKDEPRT